MTVRVYRSTDSSAPVLTGQAGSLVTLLDAVLVNGYGSKAALGWTKAFSGTNKAVYRNSSSLGTGSYMRVDDSNTSYGRSYVSGAEGATAVDTLTNPFPSATLTYSGWGKSATNDAVARPWVIIGDETRFYIFVQTGEVGTDWAAGFFGDIVSYVTSDPYRCMLVARYHSSGIGSLSHYLDYMAYMCSAISAVPTSYITMPRNHAGVYGPASVGFLTDNNKVLTNASNTFYAGAAGVLTYPNAANNGLFMAPIWVHQGTTAPYILRGHMPGLWCPLHNRPLSNNDTFSGVGAMSGKTFEAFNVYNSGQLLVETSDTWS